MTLQDKALKLQEASPRATHQHDALMVMSVPLSSLCDFRLPLPGAPELDATLDKLTPPGVLPLSSTRSRALAISESTAIRSFWTPLRQAGAVARTLLISAAAKQ